MSRKLTIKDVKDRLETVHGDLVTIVESTYVNTYSKALFVDKEYGTWSAQVKSVLKGRRHTKHKCVNFSKARQISHEKFVEKLFNVHGVNVLVGEHYENSHKKMKFIDVKYGTWEAMPYSVLAGHCHPSRGHHNRSKKTKKSYMIQHWKTGEELVCVASYEKAFVEWCNKNQYDFDWQVTFNMPDSRRYVIDAYVKPTNRIDCPLRGVYVEIKGTWNRKNGHVGKRKWEWFSSVYNNSKLLMKPELETLGIL